MLRLRKENNALKTDLDNVGENTQRLMEANVIAQESFSSLNEKAKEQRQKAKSVELSYKQQIHDLQLAQDEMNDEIKMKQAAYIAEVRSKKQYEAALSRVVDLIHDKCRDSRLVEAVLQISDEVEEQQHHDLDDMAAERVTCGVARALCRHRDRHLLQRPLRLPQVEQGRMLRRNSRVERRRQGVDASRT